MEKPRTSQVSAVTVLKKLFPNFLFILFAFIVFSRAAIAAPLVVTNTDKSGPGSLSQAIDDSNASVGVFDTITFNIPGPGVHTIQPPKLGLPEIKDPVEIDGYTQPGTNPNTLMQGNNAILLIEIDGQNAVDGTDGLTITSGGSTIRGLVINGFQRLKPKGVGKGNGNGIVLKGNGGNKIGGNFIGTDPSGTVAKGNERNGILIQSPSNQIGGLTSGERNLIAGNARGIEIEGDNNQIQGNYLGTDLSGQTTLQNYNGEGIYIDHANGNQVGGSEVGAGNLISGHEEGISVYASNHNIFQGNRIGTDAAGENPLPNGLAILLDDNSSDNLIGGTGLGEGNTIAFNTDIGIQIGSGMADLSFNNSILGNSIHDNTNLGIDLMGDGATVNDSLDPDLGPNQVQNFPVIQQITANGCTTEIEGLLNSTPNTSFRIEFFLNDKSVTGQGEHFIGFTQADTDVLGDTNFKVSLPLAVIGDKSITATATNFNGDTSEFSLEREVMGSDVSLGSLQFSSSTYSVAENGGHIDITVTRAGGSDCGVSVQYATVDGTGVAGVNYSTSVGTLDFADGETSKTFAVPILDDGVLNGDKTVNLVLTNPQGGSSLGDPNIAVLTIVESDAPADNNPGTPPSDTKSNVPEETPPVGPALGASGGGCSLTAAGSPFNTMSFVLLFLFFAIGRFTKRNVRRQNF